MYSAESYEANHIINACIDECAKSYANSFSESLPAYH